MINKTDIEIVLKERFKLNGMEFEFVDNFLHIWHSVFSQLGRMVYTFELMDEINKIQPIKHFNITEGVLYIELILNKTQ